LAAPAGVPIAPTLSITSTQHRIFLPDDHVLELDPVMVPPVIAAEPRLKA